MPLLCQRNSERDWNASYFYPHCCRLNIDFQISLGKSNELFGEIKQKLASVDSALEGSKNRLS